MPRTTNFKVHEQFRFFQNKPGYLEAAECKHCHSIASKNTTRIAQHLANCLPYLRYRLGKTDTTREREQTSLASRVTPQTKEQLDKLAGLVVYQLGLPLNFFEHEPVKNFVQSLLPSYQPPSRKTLSTTGLDAAYESVKSTVDKEIANEENVNICFDGASNITHQRILNVSAITSKAAFYYHNIVLGSDTNTAEYQAERIVTVVNEITKGQISRLNSVSGDTCPQMLKTFRLLESHPLLKTTFTIPCDPHGLQLLLGDILQSSLYAPTVEQAQQLVKHLHRADKQYQIFKDYQRQYNGGKEPLAMVAGCRTRWGSERASFRRIIGAELALLTWSRNTYMQSCFNASDAKPQTRAIASTLADPYFFTRLREIVTIIDPIVDEITQAEGDYSHVGLVIPRWNRVWKHLELMSSTSQHNWQESGLWKTLYDRQLRQLTPIHQLAYWLTPNAILNDRLPHGALHSILTSIERYIHPDHVYSAHTSFLNFYNRQGPFSANARCWQYAKDEKIFWQLQYDEHVALAGLANRLWHALANEVPSERAFSQMKIIKSKTRNRLSDENTDKLLFIQMNLRALHRQASTRKKAPNESGSDSEVDEDQHQDFEQIPISVRPYEVLSLEEDTQETLVSSDVESQRPITQPSKVEISAYLLQAPISQAHY